MVLTADERYELKCLFEMLKQYSYCTVIHSHNVERAASYMGATLSLSVVDQEKLYYGALMHDIGKLRVPLQVLNKRSELTRSEFNVIQMHPKTGVDMCRNIIRDRDILSMIGLHHINENETGYGDTSNDLEHTQLVKIVHIADVVSALFETRAYKKPFSEHEVISILQDDTKLFNSRLKDIVISNIGVIRSLVVSSYLDSKA